MIRPELPSKLPSSAQREFNKWAQTDWVGGVSLSELLQRINRVAECLPGGRDIPEGGTSRVSRTFTERSFRHYQTLQCIEVPEKDGRNAIYGYRHFLQALVVRRLLTEGVAAVKMPGLIGGSSTKDLERMFLDGVEMVLRSGDEQAEARLNHHRKTLRACEEKSITGWLRIVLGEGIELHLSDNRPKMTPQEWRQTLKRIEELVRESYG